MCFKFHFHDACSFASYFSPPRGFGWKQDFRPIRRHHRWLFRRLFYREFVPKLSCIYGHIKSALQIQAAVDSLSTSSTEDQAIFIEAGTYDEQVYIQKRNAALTIYGYTEDDSSYTSNKVTITHKAALADSDNDDDTCLISLIPKPLVRTSTERN